ncbi:hypothetical protein LSCM1_05242 [Leishmania martiniquensis]|uniref:Uncharacterized protein n=1 Tax=Leishmania martiniquensis TaxID=1580590 RepID=A0A836H3H4_9TRYP|nr:hypothetical protein LSCM1_05242 [Leishmania martiniquensis]
MEGQPRTLFNARDMRRQVRKHHRRHWQYCEIARFMVRLSIWLLGAHLISECHPRALEAYLVVSVTLICCVLPRVSGEEAGGGETVSTHKPDNDVQAHDEEDNRLLRRAGSCVRPPSAVAHQYVAPASEKCMRAVPGKAREASSDTHKFTGILTASQQRVLLLELQELRTTSATRCAMDAAFRRQLAETELGETITCICGSGEAFGSCCASVKDALLRVLGMTERCDTPAGLCV